MIKLTYYGTNRPTLVNFSNVESIYQVFDKHQKRFSTKICFRGNDSFINVEEDLKTIMKLHQEYQSGVFQDTEDIETPTIEERFEDSYYRTTERNYQPRNRERNFNTDKSYNNSMW
jgi:hypothetical protein